MPVISLFDYQKEAIRKMRNGCILCGGVGSGKSRTSLAYYYILHGGKVCTEKYVPMKNPPRDLYIITTARKRDTLEWEGELIPFLLSTKPDQNYYKNKIVIDSWNNISKYVNVKNAFFIFDEQRVVGYGAWSKSFIKISKSNSWILLSATPGDKWEDYIPVFIANGFYRNKTEFEHEHIIYKRFSKFPQVDRYVNTGILIKHREEILIKMNFERKTNSHHIDILAQYDKTKYMTLVRDRWNPFENKPIENAGEYCYNLRRVVNSDESRQIRLLEIVEDHPRVIVFYNYDYELDILKNLYYGDDYVVAEWNGHNHEVIPQTEKWIYLVQYNAGAEGWNCITTDTIVFFSQNYSYKIMVQASGRIDRLNTPFDELYYYHLKSSSGIDLAINRALKNKKRFNESNFVDQYKPIA